MECGFDESAEDGVGKKLSLTISGTKHLLDIKPPEAFLPRTIFSINL
jgi:hypothetical protein